MAASLFSAGHWTATVEPTAAVRPIFEREFPVVELRLVRVHALSLRSARGCRS